MSAKIKELEYALAAAHLQLRAGSDPPEDGGDRNPDCYQTARRRSYGDSSGSLAIDQDGVSRYYGDTAASEVCPVLPHYFRKGSDIVSILQYFTGLIPVRSC